MDVKIKESWKVHLKNEFNQPYFKNLIQFVKADYKAHKCYPPGNQIFSAFENCSINDVKVVIIGQDGCCLLVKLRRLLW